MGTDLSTITLVDRYQGNKSSFVEAVQKATMVNVVDPVMSALKSKEMHRKLDVQPPKRG